MRIGGISTGSSVFRAIAICLVELLLFNSCMYAADRQVSMIESCVPEKNGSIQMVHRNPASDKWVIHIQDAHCNAEAQNNIADILEKLQRKSCLDVVLMEGAAGAVDTSPLKSYPDTKSRDEVAKYLLECADISGSEYFSVLSRNDIPLEGIEDRQLYEDNLKALLEVLEIKDTVNSLCGLIDSEVSALAESVYSDDLKKSISHIEAYRSHQIDTTDYLSCLNELVTVNEKTTPNCAKILTIAQQHDSVTVALLEDETHELLNDFSVILSREALADLFRANLQYKMGELSTHRFYSYIVDLMMKNDIPSESYPNLYSYARLLDMYAAVDNSAVQQEIKTLEQAYLEKIYTSQDERDVYTVTQRLRLFRDYYNLTLSKIDSRYIAEHSDYFSAYTLTGLISNVDQDTAAAINQKLIQLIEYKPAVEKFYELVTRRDTVLVENTLKAMESNDTKFGALITGGFHTRGIIDQLEDAGVNFAVVIPGITREADSDLYWSVITQKKTSFEQYIESAINSLAHSSWLTKRPLGFDSIRRQVKLSKAISLFLAESVDNMYLDNPYKSPHVLLAELNRLIADYDARQIEILDFKAVDGMRLYNVSINGHKMFYYFEGNQTSDTTLRDTLLEDVHAILEKEIKIAENKSVTVFKQEIIDVLAPRFQQLEVGTSTDAVIVDARLAKQRKLRRAILDYAFMNEGFLLKDLYNDILLKHGMDLDFRGDLQPIIDDLLEDGFLQGKFSSIKAAFSLADDARLAYYLSLMAEKDNYFPEISQLLTYYMEPFVENKIGSLFVEAGMPAQAVLDLIQQLERNAIAGKDEMVFTYTDADGVLYEGRIFENQNNFRYFRMIKRTQPDVSLPDAMTELAQLEQTRAETVGSQQMIQLVDEHNTILALSMEQGEYVVSLVELGDEEHPDTILFQETIQSDDQLQDKLIGIIQSLAEQFSEYIQLQGLVVVADNKAQLINIEDIRTGMLDDILPDRQLADLLIEELGRMNSTIAGAESRAPLESLTVIDDEDMSEADITKRLSGYSANALLEVAKTTRNPAFLRVLAKNTIYSLPDSKVKMGDYATHRIKSVLIDNYFTPTDSLVDMVQDMMFFEYLLSRNPDKIKSIIAHPQAISELNQIIADQVEEKAEFIDAGIVEMLKQAIIESPLSDDTLLIRYFQDPSLNVRLTLAKSSMSDILADDPVEDVIVEVARNGSTALHNLHRFAKSDQSKAIRLAVASNNMIDLTTVETLLDQSDDDIKVQLVDTLTREELPMFKDTPDKLSEILLRLILECGEAVDSAVARAQIHLTPAVLEVLITQSQQVKELVASRMDLTDGIVKTLYSEDDPAIKQRLILNSKVSLPNSEYLKAIRKSKKEKNGWRVRLAISQRQQLNNPVMEELAKDENVKVRANLALRSDLPEDLMRDLVDDPVAFVRGYLAMNPEIPKDIVRKLAKDEAELSHGLLTDDGDILEGFKRPEIQSLRTKGTTVAQRVTSNKKVLDDSSLVDYFMHDYRYHGRMINLMTKHRNEALNNYYDKEFHKAYHRFKRFVNLPYSLYGTFFQYACTLYMISDHDSAQDYFQRSIDETNNVCARIALDYMHEHNKLIEPILFMPVQIQTMLQNLHHAQELTKRNLVDVVSFLDFMRSTIPADIRPDYVADFTTWAELLQNEAVEQVVALSLYTLRDVMESGFIDWDGALAVLEDVMRGVVDYRSIPRTWNKVKESMWQNIVKHSNLHQSVKDEMLENPSDEMEFFLRGGVRGVVKYKDYLDFRAEIVMDNIPSYLREDLAKSVWTEFIDLTEDMLFSEPQYFKRLALVKQRGSYGGFDNALKISLSLSGGKYLYGVGDINKIVRSEGGHSIANGIFHNLGMNKAVDELQDRSSVIHFPKSLDDPAKAATITGAYREHDSLLIELADVLLASNDIEDIIASLDSFRGRTIMEDFAVRNALAALRDDIGDPMAKRLIGESLFYLYRDEPSLDVIDERLPALIVRITHMKDEIASFPWDVRIFFDGGCYVNTYKQPFPVLAPPLDVIVGTEAVDKLSKSVKDEHYTGEWLHYLLRLRIRELVQQNKLDPANVHRFFRTSVVYLSHVVQQGELFGRLETILKGFSSEYSAPAMMRLFYTLNDPQMRTLHPEMRKDLNVLHKLALDTIQIDRRNLLSLLQRDAIRDSLDRTDEMYPMVVRSTIQIQERLNAGKLNAAIFSTINLIGELYNSDNAKFKNYAQKLERAFLPIEEENVMQLAGSINSFMTKFKDARQTSARKLGEVVTFIQNLEADKVFEEIEQRQVQSSEPEKVVLKEVGRQLTSNLFLTGDIGFSQFVGMMADFYAKDYQRIKGSAETFKMQEYMPGYGNAWRNLIGHIVPLLTKFSLANVIDVLQTRMQGSEKIEVASKRKRPEGVKMYSIAPWPLLGHMLGFSLVDMLLASGVVIAAGLTFFAVVKLGGHIINRFIASPQTEDTQLSDLQEQPELPAASQPFIPLVDGQVVPAEKSLLFDYDALLQSWDPLWALSYALSQTQDEPKQVFIYSQNTPREQMQTRLAAFGIDPAGVELISQEDTVVTGDTFDLGFYLRQNYGIRPADMLVVSPEESDVRNALQSDGSVVFDISQQSDIEGAILALSSLFDFVGSGIVSDQLRITDISVSNRYHDWFVSQSESDTEVKLADLLNHAYELNQSITMNDFGGVVFSVSSQTDARRDIPAPRLNVTMPSRVLESSL